MAFAPALDIQDRSDRLDRCKAPADLAMLVESFASRRAVTTPSTFPVFPTARAELLFHFGDDFRAGERRADRLLPRIALLGPWDRIYWQAAGPRIDWFLIQLTPLGCRRLLDLPFAECWNRIVSLDTLWRGDGLRLLERLAAATGFEARVELACRFLRQRVGPARSGDAVMSEAGRQARAGALRSVEALAAALDVGHRRLRQRFAAEYGTGPKHFLSLMRFGRQLEALHPLRRAEAEPADDYADQSHAIREFVRFSGITPGTYRGVKAKGDRLIFTGAESALGDADDLPSLAAAEAPGL